MAEILNKNYAVEPGPHGLVLIRLTGRCYGDQATIDVLRAGVCSRFEWVLIPNAKGAIFKPLDGVNPTLYRIEPSTQGQTYFCVKVGAWVTALAPAQPGGDHQGKTILRFEIHYQEVSGVA